MNHLDRLYKECPQPSLFARGYLAYLSQVLAQLDADAIAAFVDLLVQARERGARIFFLGNGGSAATASHFANDIAVGSKSSGSPFRAISLTDNVPMMTAIGNDFGYDDIFKRQLEIQMQPGDVVVAISASGNSPNLVKAIEHANNQGAHSVALTGFDGGRLKQIAHLNVHVPTDRGEYGPAEDGHMILDHLVGAFLAQMCAAERVS